MELHRLLAQGNNIRKIEIDNNFQVKTTDLK